MNIAELLDKNNVTISVTPADLKEFAIYIIEQTKAEEAKKNQPKEDRLLSADEAASILGVSNNTLWRWNKNGYLTHIKVGRKTFYHQSAIDQIQKKI